MRRISDAARRLNLRGHDRGSGACRLPPLIMMTDSDRLPDPLSAIAALPRGSAVILRHYDAEDRVSLARALAALCRRRHIRLLIGGDPRLASIVGADGLHVPEWMARRGPGAWQCWRRPDWTVTAAAHSVAGLRRAGAIGADAALLSPIFPTPSHPQASPIGALRFAAWCRLSPLPVYALGGVSEKGVRRLVASGAAGVAGIDRFLAK